VTRETKELVTLAALVVLTTVLSLAACFGVVCLVVWFASVMSVV
jgi:hypothetical protein